jgi:hypothetical protein
VRFGNRESREKGLALRREICISARSLRQLAWGSPSRPTWTTSRLCRFGNDEAGLGRPQI